MTIPGQPTLTYGYDDADRLKTTTQGTSTVQITYDNDNRRQSLILPTSPNPLSLTYDYDAGSQLKGITYKLGTTTTLGGLTYDYDTAGRRTTLGGSFARTGLPQPVTSAFYNDSNQLTQWGAATLTYDLNGNLVGDGANTYEWNARNQLSTINTGVTAGFQYDALGRRSSKTVGGATTAFLYDGMNVVQELSGSPLSPTANLVTGLTPDEIFSRTDGAGVRYFLTDALGSTLALTDSTGTSQAEYAYEPFGNTAVSGQASANPFQYTGRENDGTTGLYFYRARYYNSTFQRFTAEDPIGFAGGFNLYGYVQNNPVSLKDPTGLQGQGGFGIPPCKQSCSQYPPGSLLRWVCLNSGDCPWCDCVRLCLKESYLECSKFGCVIKDHIRCWLSCPGGAGGFGGGGSGGGGAGGSW